ncbi:MAG: DUF4364 family protein [Clostridia bacterium]
MIHEEVINNKLLILFILEKLDMQISEESLLQMCSVDNNWIPYFFCKQIIEELTNSNFILSKVDPNNAQTNIITINEDGKLCLSRFFKDIPYSVRMEVTEYIRNTKLEYKRQQEFVSNCKRNKDGTYLVNCQIMKIDSPIFELNFNVATRSKALAICNSWTQKAPDVYRTFLDIMVE